MKSQTTFDGSLRDMMTGTSGGAIMNRLASAKSRPSFSSAILAASAAFRFASATAGVGSMGSVYSGVPEMAKPPPWSGEGAAAQRQASHARCVNDYGQGGDLAIALT
ncbi:hypothetical protein [Kitasatospora sp. NBC_01300]|uniref:hypothetical protein n=1 Tax=Kitasatospora sp. NBC_01300 TaxID=2903574 RepID=UPI00352F2B25|nr:hypothetical protein OG556_30440 [Kitasatospora sp. NBC_01300]